MNALDRVAKSMETKLHRALRRVWDDADSHEEAQEALRSLAASLEADHPETLSCFHFPRAHRRRLRTTNGNERVNQELKRRIWVARIFPNPASCLRLASALLKEWHENWITGRCYLRMELLYELEAEPPPFLQKRLDTTRGILALLLSAGSSPLNQSPKKSRSATQLIRGIASAKSRFSTTPAFAIWGMVMKLRPYTMALGGVATGNMKAQLAPSAAGTARSRGSSPIPTARAASTGRKASASNQDRLTVGPLATRSGQRPHSLSILPASQTSS